MKTTPTLLLVAFGLTSFFACHQNPVPSAINTVVKTQHHDSIRNKKWLGDWERTEFMNWAVFDIIKIIDDTLVFSLSAQNGGYTGQIEGKAIIKGNSAQYVSDEDQPCKLTFLLLADSVITVYDHNSCAEYAGMGVGFSGRYHNARLLPKNFRDKTTETMLSRGLLHSTKEDSIFRAMVGKSYDEFVNSTEGTSTDEKDLDGFNARVASSGVRGLYTLMENIVMVDSSKNMWAAVIEDCKNVAYFTTRPLDAGSLPKTIDDWRSRFKSYPVIYKSRK